MILEVHLFVLKTGNLFNMASLVFQPVVGNLVSPEFMLPLVITLLGWIQLFPSKGTKFSPVFCYHKKSLIAFWPFLKPTTSTTTTSTTTTTTTEEQTTTVQRGAMPNGCCNVIKIGYLYAGRSGNHSEFWSKSDYIIFDMIQFSC